MTITVYSSNGCTQCKFAKELLDREGIAYEEKNISLSETYKNEVLDMGFTGVPVTAVSADGKVVKTVLGFKPDALKALKTLEERLVEPTVKEYPDSAERIAMAVKDADERELWG